MVDHVIAVIRKSWEDALEKARQTRQVGEVWQTGNRWYTRRESDGHTIRIPAPNGSSGASGRRGGSSAGNRASVSAPPPNSRSASGRRGGSSSAGNRATGAASLSPERARELVATLPASEVKETLSRMTVVQLNELKRSLGFRASGNKAQLVNRLVEQLLATVRGNKQEAKASAPAVSRQSAEVRGDGSGLPPFKAPVGTKMTYKSPDVKAKVKALLGIEPDKALMAAVGMSESRGTVRLSLEDEDNALKVTTWWGDSREGGESIRTLYRDPDGVLSAENDVYKLTSPKTYSGKGTGTRSFANQVQAYRKMGVQKIYTFAARASVMNGYYTWPRLGYNGVLPWDSQNKIPAEIKKQMAGKTVQDLFDVPGGAAWWKENGTSIKLTFDLSDGSRSMRVLEAYIKEREERDRG